MNHLLSMWTNQGLHQVFRSKSLQSETAGASNSNENKREPQQIRQSSPEPTQVLQRQPTLPKMHAESFQWEKPWSIWQKKITRGARFVFTYQALSEDFAGQANAARSAFWRTLLGQLQWPKGTVSFWPCFGYPETQLEPGYFWRGVQLIKPRFLVFFGTQLREGLLYASDRYFPNGWPGLSLELRDPDALVADQANGVAETVRTLASILR